MNGVLWGVKLKDGAKERKNMDCGVKDDTERKEVNTEVNLEWQLIEIFNGRYTSLNPNKLVRADH